MHDGDEMRRSPEAHIVMSQTHISNTPNENSAKNVFMSWGVHVRLCAGAF